MSRSYERASGLWRGLALPRVYSQLQRSLSVADARAQVAKLYVRAKAGDTVLDIGCGPADILEHLPAVDYLGMDVSSEYLAEARRRFHDRRPRVRFVQMDVRALREDGERFDVVLAQGVLHHFDDEQAASILRTVGSLMKPAARLVTVDAARTPDQHLLARLLVWSDRGRFVRSPEGYEGLARLVFSRVDLHVRHDMLRLPYTHALMECADPVPLPES